ncbi:MAG: methionine adenosyltransferase [Thaumarchaeota archaeon]|nr:methionine adenosyltransferase [Nitrososphaerota archaeon]
MNLKNRIYIEPTKIFPTFRKKFEIVERKGVGHPDTMCDLIMESIEIKLSKLYLKETGYIQHHNLDKALLVAGQTENRFGGGRVLKPMKMIIGDRVTITKNITSTKIERLASGTANSWLEDNLRFVKRKDIRYQFEFGHASEELRSLFDKKQDVGANDTSALVGYAPITPTEKTVLETERFLNSKKFKKEFKESGEDIKVMGFRHGKSLDLTIAMAFVDSYVESEKQYFKRKKEMVQALEEFHADNTLFKKPNIIINNLDKENQGIRGLYLTVLGTSADSADSGEVGRGNRANQVISLNRPSGSEAIAGKNSVTHIGKIYNKLCFKMAEEIYQKLSGIDEVYIWMYNVIGNPISQPSAVVVQPVTKQGKVHESDINRIIQENLSKIDEFCKDLMTGRHTIA